LWRLLPPFKQKKENNLFLVKVFYFNLKGQIK